MDKKEIFNGQFDLGRKDHLKVLDFVNWYRFFYIIREVIDLEPAAILEIGEGSGIVRNCVSFLVKEYKTLDINKKLNPDFLSDLRDFKNEIKEKFQCVIAADILEHLPFSDLEKSVRNIYDYVSKGGRAIITIPHRRSHFLFMVPDYKPHVVTIPTGFLTPVSFYQRFIKRIISIDAHHCWEIGDGRIKRSDVESAFRKTGFKINKFRKLLYVDFWVLEKGVK